MYTVIKIYMSLTFYILCSLLLEISEAGVAIYNCMIAGFSSTFSISAYHHLSYEFVFPSVARCTCIDTTLYETTKFESHLQQSQWFSVDTPVPSTNVTDHMNINEMLFKWH
jgi:hypothetical protein